MSPEQTVEWALSHHYHSDLANAAVHTSPVRFSPLTFRLAELYQTMIPGTKSEHVRHVLSHANTYPEDRGRVEQDVAPA
jgi:hypothetical protein